MRPYVGEFNLNRLERVISGPNTIAAIGAEVDRRGLSRVVVATGKTLGASALLDRITTALGPRLAGVFTGCRQHVPSGSVDDLVALVRTAGADTIVSFGGGSPIDTVKVAVHTLGPDAVCHIAVPTTLSAGEFTAVAGVTDEATRVKHGVSDPRIAPRTVVTDPTLTLETPEWLWAATGMRAMDHAIESIYSLRHHPLSDTLASRAIALLLEHLPPSIHASGQEQLDHRAHCQMGAWLSVVGLTNAGFGLSHAFGHQIGPRWDVPHGITSCITLPHAMRFMAELAPERFGPIAAGFGIAFSEADPKPAALACADRTAAFIEQLELPHRLRDAQVPREQIGDVAGIVHEAMERAHVVDRAVTRDELMSLLVGAY